MTQQHHAFTPSDITLRLPLNLQQHRCIVVTNNSHGPSLVSAPPLTARLPKVQKSTFTSTSLSLSVHDTSSSSSSGNKAASRWDQMFNLLSSYKQREKDCNVPQRHKEDDENLGIWLANQRQANKKDKLNDERKRQLEDLGVVWEPRSPNLVWEDMLILLTQYKDNNGHCNVPQVHKEDNENLGVWLANQRRANKKEKLNDERKRQLEDLGVVWELTSTTSWEDMFILLSQYKANNGHCNVPQRHKEDDENLGTWLDTQRQEKKKEKLNDERKRQLEDLGVVWQLNSTASWEDMFILLTQYTDNNGHCNVPQCHKEDNENLGDWLNRQRQVNKKDKLNNERRRQLENLGVVWELRSTTSWEDMFILLTQYKNNNGHCNVPGVHKEDNENLGTWLTNQRQANKKDKLNDERKRQLEDLGVVW